MALNRKYAALPDLDQEQDIFETPELIDDASTAKTTTLATSSPAASDAEDVSDTEEGQIRSAINRRRINQDEARTRFEPSQVDARGVDFSDKLGSAHRSYRISNRRRRRSRGGTEELGDLSEDEQEPIQVRLARLRREAEELKQQIEEAEAEGKGTEADGTSSEVKDSVKALSSMLDSMNVSSKGPKSAEDKLLRSLATRPEAIGHDDDASVIHVNGVTADQPSSFAAAAALADRLTALETSIGITAASTTSSTSSVLPTLSALSAQITTLTTTLTPAAESLSGSPNVHLDELSTRIRTLINESERLTSARKAATAAAVELSNARAAAAAAGPSHTEQVTAERRVAAAVTAANANMSLSILDDQTAKVKSLYQTLPTITSLHPILPTVLERLRSLSAIHAGAAQAAADLEEVEKRQASFDDEIKKWREGLERVEAKMKESEDIMKGNVEVMGGKLKQVEEKLDRLGSA